VYLLHVELLRGCILKTTQPLDVISYHTFITTSSNYQPSFLRYLTLVLIYPHLNFRTPISKMRSFNTLIAAAGLIGLASASPFMRRYEECKAPQQWYTCGDDWQGCCSVNPCKGPAEGVKSHCPGSVEPSPSATTSTVISTSPTACKASTTPTLAPDTDWTAKCNEDDSNCNWAPRFFIIKTDNETYTTYNRTTQFHVQKGAGTSRIDSIAHFTNIPSTVTRCTMKWYKPSRGIFYGTWNDGAMNISTLDLGGKPFVEAIGSKDISYQNTKSFIEAETVHGVLDLGNWGKTPYSAFLSGPTFDCKESELVVHFALNAPTGESAVTVDQVSNREMSLNNYVQRAGWFLQYE
jgi:hypothetical protein